MAGRGRGLTLPAWMTTGDESSNKFFDSSLQQQMALQLPSLPPRPLGMDMMLWRQQRQPPISFPHPSTEHTAGERRAADVESANAAKRPRNTGSGLEADDSSENDGGLNGENSGSEGEDTTARLLRPDFFESAMQLFNERRGRYPSAWSVDSKFVTPRPLGSLVLHSVLMAATTADDFVVLQAMGRQADGDSLIWKLVAKALGPASVYNQNFRLGEFFYTKVENEAIALFVTRVAGLKLVKKVTRMEVDADFSVDSIPGNRVCHVRYGHFFVRSQTCQILPLFPKHCGLLERTLLCIFAHHPTTRAPRTCGDQKILG